MEVKALSFTTIFISVARSEQEKGIVRLVKPKSIYVKDISSNSSVNAEYIYLENSIYSLGFDSKTGNLEIMSNRKSGVKLNNHQEYREYINGTGGAYILVEPNPSTKISKPATLFLYEGKHVKQLTQFVSSSLWLKTRIYVSPNSLKQQQQLKQTEIELESFVHQQHHVGPIPLNREYITLFNTNLKTQNYWYTDSSGLEIAQRQYSDNIPGNVIGGNYHAMVSTSYIKDIDRDAQFTVLTRQSMGVTSQASGQLEIMLHRRTNSSDQQGPVSKTNLQNLFL